MDYSVRFAHLKDRPNLTIGQKIFRGDPIGIIGNTGQSDGRHLHIDLVEGFQNHIYRLNEIGTGRLYTPDLEQLTYFIDAELFKTDLEITTHPYCPDYLNRYGKFHPAYDLVPRNRASWAIYWNRSKEGKVLFNDYDNGYGHCLIIGFEA